MRRRTFVSAIEAASARPALARELDAKTADAIAAAGVPIPASSPRRADGIPG